MKFLCIFIAFVASILTPSGAAITRPEAVLTQIDALETEVFGYQTTILDQISTFRAASGGTTADYYNQTLTVIEENIQAISDSDTDVRTTLGAQTPGACITNLNNFLDQIIELSGYAISNCIEDDNSTNNATSDLMALLDELDRYVATLPQVIIDAMIGRNIFTEGDAIVARVAEHFAEHKADIDAMIAEITAMIEALGTSANSGAATLKTCFEETVAAVGSGVDVVNVQVATCSKFGGRAPRSNILPNPIDFFPWLK